jgi:hypothetical protein
MQFEPWVDPMGCLPPGGHVRGCRLGPRHDLSSPLPIRRRNFATRLSTVGSWDDLAVRALFPPRTTKLAVRSTRMERDEVATRPAVGCNPIPRLV